jgi:hypothetical protein
VGVLPDRIVDAIPVPLPETINLLRSSYTPVGERDPTDADVGAETSTPQDVSPTFPVTAMGGTFDHLHAGHKILLSMSAWITSEKLIVGMTGMDHHSRTVFFFLRGV